MAKRSPNTTENKLKKGIGQGHGKDYKPWLTVRDVPSQGLSTRIHGWKTGRVHHFLSLNELHCYYTFEWAKDVIDIREQYPLDLDQTLDIASRLNVKHPSQPKSDEPIVMTTDFLLDIQSGSEVRNIAISVKPADDLSSIRVQAKQSIEYLYWTEKRVPWYIITELEIPKILAKNVEWIHTARWIEDSPGLSITLIRQIEPVLYELIMFGQVSPAESALATDSKLGLNPGSCLWIIRYLIANRYWTVSMGIFKRLKKGCRLKAA